ncbi:hypothetical protein BD311DRAFT_275823 [Dichomitus squalens]|uniref:Secreted protein n=1 Tax=Dichomitus squalens TaxID=114155 RepID=A0A4Q9MP30_9APHY|nr:hypothetical protein BD311DRAFT_275823 [Dichomitus squalens]
MLARLLLGAMFTRLSNCERIAASKQRLGQHSPSGTNCWQEFRYSFRRWRKSSRGYLPALVQYDLPFAYLW